MRQADFREALAQADRKQRGQISEALALHWPFVQRLHPNHLAPWAQRAIAEALGKDEKEMFQQ